MRRSVSTSAIAGLLLSLAVALPVAAGGWAAVVADAGQPPADDGSTVVGFYLLQHGVTAVAFGEARVIATNADDGTVVRAAATLDSGGDGHWTATLMLAPGTWSYTVLHSQLEIATSAPIAITTAGPASAAGSGAAAAGTAASSNAMLALALLGAVAAVWLAAMALVVRYRRRDAAAPARG